MVYEHLEESQNYNDENYSLNTYGSTLSDFKPIKLLLDFEPINGRYNRDRRRSSLASIQVPAYEQQPDFMLNNGNSNNNNNDVDWSSIAEATMPLKTSELLKANNKRFSGNNGGNGDGNGSSSARSLFQSNHEFRSKEISRKLVRVNLISLLINLSLAIVAFYFSFVNNSSSTSAFAADCVLDFISSAIVLWRYYGDLDSVYMHAREQIACIYLGALFEISAFAIIIKATSDIATGIEPEAENVGYDLVYLAVAATIACTVLTVFKCMLYRTIRDNSILLDVINTVISTVFAMSIIMSQLLINVDSSFWYMDPILSIVLAIFMACFGLKVISENFNILRPGHNSHANNRFTKNHNANDNYGAYSTPLLCSTGRKNSKASLINQVTPTNWQKTDYSTITFVE